MYKHQQIMLFARQHISHRLQLLNPFALLLLLCARESEQTQNKYTRSCYVRQGGKNILCLYGRNRYFVLLKRGQVVEAKLCVNNANFDTVMTLNEPITVSNRIYRISQESTLILH